MSLNVKAISASENNISQFALKGGKLATSLNLWTMINLEKSKVDDFHKEKDPHELEEQLELHKKVESHLEEERQRKRRKMKVQENLSKKEKKKQVQLLLNIL